MGLPRSTPSLRFGAIDLGSHTIRLLVGELKGGRVMEPLHGDRRVTRLAQGFHPDQSLKEPAMERSLRVLEEYARVLKTMRTRTIACGATGVLRRARNKEEFLHRAHQASGISPRLLSEQDEALLSAKGVLSVLPPCSGVVVLFDLGGSSTEFTVVHPLQHQKVSCTSVFLGAATTTERFLQEDPPGKDSLNQAAAHIISTLKPTLERVVRNIHDLSPSSPPITLVGTAGTVTTLAAMKLKMTDYRAHRVNGLTLERDWIAQQVEELASSTLEQRRRMAGLEKGREDIILGGALVVQKILEGLHLDRMVVTDAGLLEGLLLDGAQRALELPETLLSPLTWHTQKG